MAVRPIGPADEGAAAVHAGLILLDVVEAQDVSDFLTLNLSHGPGIVHGVQAGIVVVEMDLTLPSAD
jgi:hypothetical protein